MSSELDELRKMIDQQLAAPRSVDDIPLHGEGVVPLHGESVDPNSVRITVSGEAMTTAAGAVVVDSAGTEVPTDLPPWPDATVGKQVRVSGIVTSTTQDQGLQQATYSEAGAVARSEKDNARKSARRRASRMHQGPNHWHVERRSTVIICGNCEAKIPTWKNPDYCPECEQGKP